MRFLLFFYIFTRSVFYGLAVAVLFDQLCVSCWDFEMCCLPKRLRKTPRPPQHPRPKPRHVDHNPISTTSTGSSITTSSNVISSDFSRDSRFSVSSAGSLAGIRDVLPDGPILYRFREICRATDNFSPSKKVGNSVWKGILRDTTVAISKKQGCVGNLREMLKTVSSLHHANLVRLLGGCREGEHLYLVYEFMDGANLRECLRSKQVVGYSALSSWKSRMQIAVDVAKGLEYLHHLISPSFVHKYIDSRNIVVSNDGLRAKIAHFGIAALTEEARKEFPDTTGSETAGGGEIREASEQSSERRLARSRSVQITGIQGYMPPEYVTLGEITPMYDIFSFGVVLLELLTGQEAVTRQMGAPGQVEKRVFLPDMLQSIMMEPDSRVKLRRWMDPLLKDSYPLDDAYKVAALAKSCVDPDPLKRPQMSDVAMKLHKYLISSRKWEATMGAQREMMSSSLQPR